MKILELMPPQKFLSVGGIADKSLSELNAKQLFRIDFTVTECLSIVFVLHNYEPEDFFRD